jgi:6-pyruvoyl-tetrahydropterin synthase
MKYLDYAAFGAASGAYGAASSAYVESSRARAEVAALWEENQRLRDDMDSQKYEREFQKWAEEMIYQFAKTVKAITNTPGEPVSDFIDIASFLHLIESKELDTSHINGLDHKEKFDETLLKAQNLLTKLETNEQVQKYIRQQEATRQEHERQEQQALQLKASRVAEELSHIKTAMRVLYLLFGAALLSWSLAAWSLTASTIPSELIDINWLVFIISPVGIIIWFCLDAKYHWRDRAIIIRMSKRN